MEHIIEHAEEDRYSEYVSLMELMYCYQIEEANDVLNQAEEFPFGTVLEQNNHKGIPNE